MNRSQLDVCIIGDGPAACTLALMLGRSGISVTFIGKSCSKKLQFGESLTPDIKTLLIRLGIWNQFLNDKHLQSSGNLSSWGEKEIRENNFIFHPNTYGWHIDRTKFNDMFRKAAILAGARYLNSKFETINKNCDNTFSIKLSDLNNSGNTKEEFNANFIVDATGRGSWFSCRQGIRRKVFDTLCGYVCFLSPGNQSDSNSMALIESVADGWWYTALLPKNIRVISFFTNYELPVAKSAKTIKGWKKLIRDTNYIKVIINKYDYNIISGPHIMLSNSTRLVKVIGDHWLAVGDTVATYDPLSSKGILNAIVDGIDCSSIIKHYLEGNFCPFEEYNQRMTARFDSYLKKRVFYYNLEKRWKNSDFWTKNQTRANVIL